MRVAFLDRVLSLGQSDAIQDGLSRHVRVTNALALIGVVLAVLSSPLDAFGSSFETFLIDLLGAAVFASCWILNARGHRNAARIVLLLAANSVMLAGVLELGAAAEPRAVFFPLVLMPFLVFSVSERGWLTVFIALPVVAYFVTGRIEHPPIAVAIYAIYAPLLAFTMIITGSVVFGNIEQDAAQRLAHARACAAHSAQLAALGEMSSGIAHEIRNPLAAIHLAATEIAVHPADPTQVAQLGERIQRIVMRASRIIDSLRSFSRDASGDPFVMASVERVIADTLELCGKRLIEQGVVLTVSPVPPDLVVECRPVQVSQVLMNLLGNAYDAVSLATDRWVRIDVHTDRSRLELAVTDSGPGIPQEARPRIFEPFFTTKGPDRGTGLGLSLSHGLIDAHNGTLDLDTESPHTRFVIRIPLTQPRVASAT